MTSESAASTTLDSIAFEPNFDLLMAELRVRPGTEDAEALQRLVSAAAEVARPRAVYRVAAIQRKEQDTVEIEDVTFSSRVLRVNLEPTQRVFAFVATCGPELESWARGIDDWLEQYWADAIMEAALHTALAALDQELATQFQPGHLSMMNPGSLEDWPLSEQRPLFDLLGPAVGEAGVRLTDSLLMQPTKTVSGLLFAAQESFASCLLCPIEGCPNRRAEYDPLLYEQKYGSSA